MSKQRGTHERESESTRYYTVNDGKFVRRVKDPNAKTKERILEKGANAGKVVYEEQYSSIVGRLIEIKQDQSKEKINGAFLKNWVFVLDTTDDKGISKAVINTPFSSGYSSGILFCLPNINLNDDVEIAPWKLHDKEKNKDIFGISVYQDGKKINRAFSKEQPGKLPPLEKVMFKGEEKWDDTKQINFLTDVLVPEYNGKLKALYGDSQSTHDDHSHQEINKDFPDATEKGKDLPF